MRKSVREKKETKEGEKVAPAKATFRLYNQEIIFLVHEYWGFERLISIEVSAPAFFLRGSHVRRKFRKRTT